MEKNKVNQLGAKELDEAQIRNFSIIQNLVKENKGKGITLEQVKDKLKDIKEFYVHWGEYPSNVQSHPTFKYVKRQTFSLGLKDINLSPLTIEFIQKEFEGHHIGFKEEFGFILFKNVSQVVEYPALLVEEIQSDLARYISIIYSQAFENLDEIEWEDWEEDENTGVVESAELEEAKENQNKLKKQISKWENKYGGEEGLKTIKKEVGYLTKDYEKILLSAFLRYFKGKTIFMSEASTAKEYANVPEAVASKIYDKLPKSFGFEPSQEYNGFWKLETARNKRKIKIAQVSLDISKAKVIHGVKDSHGGELFGVSKIYDPESGTVYGYANWSYYSGKVWLQMIEISEPYKLKSLGKNLYESLKQYVKESWPSAKIVWSGTTDEGQAFKESIKASLSNFALYKLSISHEDATNQYIQNWPKTKVTYNGKTYKLNGIGWTENDKGQVVECLVLESPEGRIDVEDMENVNLI